MARITARCGGALAGVALLLVSLLGVVQADSMVSTLPGVSRTLGSGGRLAGIGGGSARTCRVLPWAVECLPVRCVRALVEERGGAF